MRYGYSIAHQLLAIFPSSDDMAKTLHDYGEQTMAMYKNSKID